MLHFLFIQQIYVLDISNMLHTLRFFSSSKRCLFHNATFFGSCIIHILNTGVLKFKTKFLRQRVNRTQSRVVIGLLTGHNTLIKYLYIMGLSNNLTCRKCGTEVETSVHILCECKALASLIHTHLGSFFLDPEDLRKFSTGAIWNYDKGMGLL
jgi:hypothetical protein